MEYQLQSKFLDKIQIEYGTVLNIIKYKALGYHLSSSIKFNKTNSKKVCRGVVQSTIDIQDKWTGKVYPSGTYFTHNLPIEKVSPGEYRYELKISGGTIEGSRKAILKKLESIINIIKE